MLDKEDILGMAKATVIQKIESIQKMFDDLSEALNTSTKSSAGDKHETSRSMTQLEQEKLGKQIAGLASMKAGLDQIDPEKVNDKIEFGSLVRTDKGSYLISVGLGVIDTSEGSIYYISATSPIGKELIGKRKGDQIEFQGKSMIIGEVL